MRFYGFGNYYLSSLQQGLQAGHAVAELFVKHNHADVNNASAGDYTLPEERNNLAKADYVLGWAENHKTMVLLNGGNSADLQELFEFLETNKCPFPFVKFHEDEVSLNGALTYVGMILPAQIYETAAVLRRTRGSFYNEELGAVQIPDLAVGNDTNAFVLVQMTAFEFELMQRLNEYGLAK